MIKHPERSKIILISLPIVIVASILAIFFNSFSYYKKYDKPLMQANKYLVFAHNEKNGFFQIRGDGSERKKLLKAAPDKMLISPDKKYAFLGSLTSENESYEDFEDTEDEYEEFDGPYIYSNKSGKLMSFLKGQTIKAIWLPDNRLLTIDHSKPNYFNIHSLPNTKPETIRYSDKINRFNFEEEFGIELEPMVSKNGKFLIFTYYYEEGSDKFYVKTIVYDLKSKKIIQSKRFSDLQPQKTTKARAEFSKKYKTKKNKQWTNVLYKKNYKTKINGRNYKINSDPLRIESDDKIKTIFGSSYPFVSMSTYEVGISHDGHLLAFLGSYSPIDIAYKEYLYITDIKTANTSRLIQADQILGIIKMESNKD